MTRRSAPRRRHAQRRPPRTARPAAPPAATRQAPATRPSSPRPRRSPAAPHSQPATGAGSCRCATIGSMIDELVDQIESRFAELERQMADPSLHADRENAVAVGREYNELRSAHELAQEWLKLKDDLEGARELLAEDGDDPELKQVLADAPPRLEELAEEIRLAMVERDPNDDKNVIVEIRAGTGGGAAASFAGV